MTTMEMNNVIFRRTNRYFSDALQNSIFSDERCFLRDNLKGSDKHLLVTAKNIAFYLKFERRFTAQSMESKLRIHEPLLLFFVFSNQAIQHALPKTDFRTMNDAFV